MSLSVNELFRLACISHTVSRLMKPDPTHKKRKWPEGFPVLHFQVQHRLHISRAGSPRMKDASNADQTPFAPETNQPLYIRPSRRHSMDQRNYIHDFKNSTCNSHCCITQPYLNFFNSIACVITNPYQSSVPQTPK